MDRDETDGNAQQSGFGRSIATALLDRDHSLFEKLTHPRALLLSGNCAGSGLAPEPADAPEMDEREFEGISDLARRVKQAIDASTYDFRTPPSLARELGASEADVRAALKHLGDEVRHPIGGGKKYRDWYRSSARRQTVRELWWRARAILGGGAAGRLG